jgi:hypothetical protein
MEVEADLLRHMDDTYLSSLDIPYDVLLEEYLLDMLLHTFGLWLSHILGHVVDDLSRWSCYTSLMSHNLIYSWCMLIHS